MAVSTNIPNIHLISLPALTPTLAAPLRKLYKWKEVTFGTGQDYFVPRPRALATFQNQLLRSPNIYDCAVLSNCARLDIYIYGHSPRRAVAECLAGQITSFQSRPLREAFSFLDLPGMINETPSAAKEEVIKIVEEGLVELVGGKNVTTHVCVIAAGMAERPGRVGREVQFRPFSSRDAHVMLQLKRTAELAQGKRVRAILDAALQAGKAARDVAVVPELETLRGYGGDGRYASTAPRDLSAAAADAAMILAILPAVERCNLRLRAMDASEAVSSLRKMAQDKVESRGLDWKGSEEAKHVRRIIHAPTMELREGKDIDYEDIVEQIANHLPH